MLSPWSLPRQNGLPTSPVSPQQQRSERDYNFRTHEEDNPYIYPSYNGSPGTANPEANYGNKYSSAMHMKPLFNSSTPGLPKSNYVPREKQQIGYPRSEEREIPYRFGHVQIKSDY